MKHRISEYNTDRRKSKYCFSVLVVDNDFHIRASLESLLTARGYHVTVADSGEQAMDQLAHNGYDLMVLDLKLPNAGGAILLDFVAERGLNLAIIIISDDDYSIAELTTALSRGTVDRLRKPLNLEDLLSRVAKVRRALRQTQASGLLHKLCELSLVGTALANPESKRWIHFNDRFCEILGYPREELANLTWAEIVHPDDLSADANKFERILCGDSEVYPMNKRFIRKDGAIVLVTLYIKYMDGDNDKIEFLVATVNDYYRGASMWPC